MQTGYSRPLTPAFARRVLSANLLIVAVAVLALVITTRQVLHSRTQRMLVEQARLCAAALVPGRNGDLSESVHRLQDRYDRLIAVATLDAHGKVRTVHPERPSHRTAVRAFLAADRHPVLAPVAPGGELISVSGAVVPLNGIPSPATQKAVVLFRDDLYADDRVTSTALVALLLGLTALLSADALKRWFDHRIAGPLRSMAGAVRDPLREPGRVPELDPGKWHETAQIAVQFRKLLEAVAEGDALARSTERESLRRIRDREQGFDCELRRVKDQAAVDPLTGLRNRSFLDEDLEPLFQRHQRKHKNLSAVMFDVDDFKRYNDTKGHQAGDAVLRFLGGLLRGGIRPTDSAIRYGGDEFLLLLAETTPEQAGAIAERLVKLFGQYTASLGPDHNVSISAGVACLTTEDLETGHELVAKADTALYAAKQKGKNAVVAHQAA
ncbi:MAG: diguanylate cyclase [Phycisphaerales bacterium]|nr:MAG: diguanylate cyclase [Phycisphaerales bacterium]